MIVKALEPEPFVKKAACCDVIPPPMAVVLDNQIAGIVYCFGYKNVLYWMNDFVVSSCKKAPVRGMDQGLLRVALSLKVALNYTSRTSLISDTISLS